MNQSVAQYKKSLEDRKKINKAVFKDSETNVDLDDVDNLINPYKIELPEDLKTAITTALLNKSIADVMSAAANAYMYDKADPNLLRITHRRPSWN